MLEIGVYSALIHYNDGVNGMNRIFEKLNLDFGRFAQDGAVKIDVCRVKKMDIKETDKFKNIRKRKRAERKGFGDKEKEKEGGSSYVSGNY